MAKKAAPPAPTTRTLGPVRDLEVHLPPEWWRGLFNAIYLKTDGDVVENVENTQKEVDLLVAAAHLTPQSRVLDLCCGQGRHCLELARRGFRQVTGLDRSRYLVRLARKRSREGRLTASFHEGDARSPRLPDNAFDCVAIMGNSFGYFDREEDDLSVLEAVRRVLVSEGTLAIDLADGAHIRRTYEKRSWEWIDQKQFVCRERSLSADQTRLVCREVVTHAEKGVIVDQFYAERLYSRDQIQSLLERAGFRDIVEHGDLVPASDRDQDLGMMAHRFFITARAPKKAAAKAPTKTQPVDALVLLGDPTLPDPVKLGGRFNPEDIEVIDRLKTALAELKGYRFRFLDRHAAYMAELPKQKPGLVVNFCDEGLRNDPDLELHVPALLEVLGLPYTGSGPACLGLCVDKSLVRTIAASLGVAVPAETLLRPDDLAAALPIDFPVIVKPCVGDGSIGITQDSVIHTPDALVPHLDRLRETLPGRPLLVQEFLPGTEYTVGVIGNPQTGFRVLPILEVDYSGLDAELPQILGYESKWHPTSPYWTKIRYVKAQLEDDLRRRMSDSATTLFERLGCRDYARFDFRTGRDGVVKLLEVNPNPGWCWDGKLAMMAGLDGMTYADFIRMLIEAAEERLARARRTASKGGTSAPSNGANGNGNGAVAASLRESEGVLTG